MTNIVQPTQEQLETLVSTYLQNQSVGLAFAIGYAAQSFNGIFLAGNLVNQRQLPMVLNADTPFEIASVTKTFTATLYAYYLQGFGNKNIDLGAFPLTIGSQFASIPIQSLVNYTSGLPQDNNVAHDLPPYLPQPYSLPGVLGYLNFTRMTPAASGVKYAYSNLGFAVMAAVIPYLAGSTSTYEQLAAETIFGPLSMSSVFFESVRLDQLPQCYNYSGTSYSLAAPGWTLFPGYDGAGGIVASSNDMMAWLQLNMGLSANANLTPLLPALQSPSTQVLDPWGDNLGLGWFLTPASSTNFASVWKDGGLSGFNSYIALLPSPNPGTTPSQAGVFVLTNSDGIVDENGVEISASLANDVLSIMQGLSPPADKSLYPRSTPSRPIIRR